MSDQVVLITGALSGIGRAAAIIFAQEGERIVVSGRRDKEGQALVAELQGLGAEAIFVRTDVRKDEDVRNLVDQAVKRFGRLDIAVNNAGTEGTPGPVTEQTAETYAATFDTNVLSHVCWPHRGTDKIRCTGSCRDRSSGKRSCSRHYRHRYAHSLHQHR
jgi:NAD(P)-dependent dehydrogenase (short-subunit alcohol dehydrogenase family)